jgi:hypothetical protein
MKKVFGFLLMLPLLSLMGYIALDQPKDFWMVIALFVAFIGGIIAVLGAFVLGAHLLFGEDES